MTEKKHKIFIVDDDPIARLVIADEFTGDPYEIHEFSSGEACLAALDRQPDVILLDVELPVMKGYQICQRLKDSAQGRDVVVIFISAHDSVEEKLAGYDAGGSDFLIKPIQPLELHQKVKLALKDRTQRAGAAVEQQAAMQIALTAISSAGEQGIVLDFMRRSFTVESAEALAELLVESFRRFGVGCSVQLRGSQRQVNAGTNHGVSPLEVELLTQLRDAGRIKEVGNRLVANFGDISLLIKNMPEEEERRGRLRDHLALLLEGAETRFRALETDESLARLVSNSRHALHGIESMQQEQKKASMQIMDEVLKSLEASFLSWGLTEEQEAILLKIVQDGVDESLKNFEQGLKIDEMLAGIVTSLEGFTRQ